MGLIDTLFGNTSESRLKKLRPYVERINALEPAMQAMSDAELRAQTERFRARLAAGETLDDLMCEAFATVREAAVRTVQMRHFDVQLLGGMVLHQGRIAEMKTGEGKTLVATLPAYLNALNGKGVHIVTVNDYLARRDAQWMGKIHRFLGLSVGCIVHGLTADERRAAYACDITYGTNNEFGFDYLRDNMVVYREQMVQRDLVYAIIDEVDSILIDEARTPLIISGAGRGLERAVPDGRPLRAPPHARGRTSTDQSRSDQLLGEVQQAEDGDYQCDIKQPHRAAHRRRRREGGEVFRPRRASPTRTTRSSTTTSSRRCARTRCSSATRITSCRTGRSSSWTSSPAASCSAAATTRGCTRRSRPRRA